MSIVFGFYVPVGRIDEKENDIYFEGGGTVLNFFVGLFGVYSSYYILCMHSNIAIHYIVFSFVYRGRLPSFLRSFPRPHIAAISYACIVLILFTA
jgi:hypothetical protein